MYEGYKTAFLKLEFEKLHMSCCVTNQKLSNSLSIEIVYILFQYSDGEFVVESNILFNFCLLNTTRVL